MIQFLRGTQTQLNSSSQVFAAGQPIFESDSGQLKIGNGSSRYSSLPYVGANQGSSSYPQLSSDTDIFDSYMDLSDKIRVHWGRFSIPGEVEDYNFESAGTGWEIAKQIYPLTVSNRIGQFMCFSLEVTGGRYTVYSAANQFTSIYVTFLRNTAVSETGWGQLAYIILDVIV